MVPFEFQDRRTNDDAKVLEAFWDDGESCWETLRWVNWDFLSFTEGKQTSPESEWKPLIKTPYRTLAVVVWATSREAEALFREEAPYDVGYFLNDEDLSQPSDVRADRMLGCIERRGRFHFAAWTQTMDVLEFCLERGLHEQASRGIRIAAMVEPPPGFELFLFHYVSRYGWEVVEDALEQNVCSPDVREPYQILGPLHTMLQLAPWMPVRITLDALVRVVQFVERHGRNRFRVCNEYRFSIWERFHRNIWVTLLSVVVGLELSCTESEISSAIDEVVVRLGKVMEGFDEIHIEPVYHALLQCVINRMSNGFEELRAISRRRFHCSRRESWEKMAKFVITHKIALPYDMRCDVCIMEAIDI